MILPARLVALLDQHAPWQSLPLCPELHAWHAPDELPLWLALEQEAGATVPPPMFALCWPGSQALARLVLDGQIPVAGRRVADLGCGSGVTAAAVARAGGKSCAVDIDPLALSAAAELARRHGVSVETQAQDWLHPEASVPDLEVILGGDLFYSATGAQRGAASVARWRAAGISVWLADAGRPYFTPCGLELRWSGEVAVPRGVEGVARRVVRVFGP